jgi:iron complex outermembrane recepter protein
MKKLNYHLTAFSLFLLSCFQLNAQHITGSIVDAQSKPQEFATVMLMYAKDSSLTKGAVTDFDGKFDIEGVTQGRYFINVSIVGFKNFSSKPFDFDGTTNLEVDKILLQNLDKELQEVTVTARKPMIEVKADRTVFNVENSPNAVGLNALELLRKSPGVQVDKDENVLLKGKQNVLVYINGKPSQMSGRDLAAFLKGLSSADIEAIEIMSNPGAKFDAAGNAGIVNIRLKKNKKLGTNGNISVGVAQGFTPKTDEALSLNYRGAKWNLFSNYSYQWGGNRNTTDLDNTINLNNGQYNNLWINRNLQNYVSNDHNFKVGADYTVNPKSTLGFMVNGGIGNPTFTSTGRTDIGRTKLGGGKDFISRDSILFAESKGDFNNKNMNYNLNYRFADTSGHELNVDADYGNFRNGSLNYLPNIYRSGDETTVLTQRTYRNMAQTNIDIKSFKADYEQLLSKTNKKAGKLGVGFKVSDVKTNNNFDFYNVINNKDFQDTSRTNFFTYKEQIQAAYANYNTQLGKFGIQLGVRGENTTSKGDLKTKQTKGYKDVDTSYFNVFPTAAFSYQLSEKHAFNLTYRYSLDRPSYQDLNPFENRLDELTYERGNTTLRPQYTHTAELGYTFMGFANLGFNYAKTKDFFTQYTDQSVQNGITTFFISKANLANRENYGLSLSTPLPINKWWNGFFNAWWNHSLLKANLGDGKTVNLKVNGGGFYMQHGFTLGKGWSTEVDGFMSFGGLWGNFVSQTQGMLNVGVSKKFWDGDGVFKLSLGDVLGTAQWKAYTELGTLRMDALGTWEGQQLKANFTYRFGNKNVQSARNRKTGLEDEKNRVKSGKG